MSQTKEGYEAKKIKDGVKTLNALKKKIENGEFVLVNWGFWTQDGHTVFRMDFRDNLDSKVTIR